MSELPILIAGAGIGGLTAACALRRVGFAVQVLERAAEIRAVGAGISLQPNALAALRSIGLADALIAEGHRAGPAKILRPNGQAISEMDLREIWPQEVGMALHRATLQRVLADQVGAETVTLGAEITAFEESAESVAVTLKDGSIFKGQLLIGADGIRSAVRRQLLGDGEPIYAGYYCWRGVCDGFGDGAHELTEPLGFMSETWGRGQRLGLVPIDGGRVYWFAVVNGPPGGEDVPGQVKTRLQELFGHWHAPVAEIIAATPEEKILRGDILYRRPTKVWGKGRVTLLGDAAHPMTPDFGQGACQAIEDAVVLAACLEESGAAFATAEALRRYETLRQPRTAAIVQNAARFGRMGQWQNPLLCSLRDWLNSHVPQNVLEKEVSRLWRFPGPAPRH